MAVRLATMDLNAKHLSSALQHTNIINESLKKETEAGRILGPFHYPTYGALDLGPYQNTMVVGGSYITSLHLLEQVAINDFIDSNTYTLSYCTVDDAYTIINKLGRGALLSKIDLKNAFRLTGRLKLAGYILAE